MSSRSLTQLSLLSLCWRPVWIQLNSCSGLQLRSASWSQRYHWVKARARKLQISLIKQLKLDNGVSLVTATCPLVCFLNSSQSWIHFSRKTSRSHSDSSCQHRLTQTSLFPYCNAPLKLLKSLHAESKLTWCDFTPISQRHSLCALLIANSEKPFSVYRGSTPSWLNVKSSRPLVGTFPTHSMIAITRSARTRLLTTWAELPMCLTLITNEERSHGRPSNTWSLSATTVVVSLTTATVVWLRCTQRKYSKNR